MKKGLLFILLVQNIVFAQVDVKTQEERLDALSQLNYMVKVAEAKAALAQAKLDCQKAKGCGFEIQPTVTKKVGDKTKKLNIRNKVNLNTLRTLRIDAIVGNQVVFSNLEGGYQVGEAIFKGIKIVKIDNTSVTLLNTLNGVKKVITMNWIKD